LPPWRRWWWPPGGRRGQGCVGPAGEPAASPGHRPEAFGRRSRAGGGRAAPRWAGHQGPADRRRVRGHRARGRRGRAGQAARSPGGHARRPGPGPGGRPRFQHHPLGLPQGGECRCRLEARGHRPWGHRGRARHRGRPDRARPGRPAGPGDRRPHRADGARQEPVGELDCSDRYGHGTFIAGLVAGNGASSAASGRASPPRPASCRSRPPGPTARPTSATSWPPSSGWSPSRSATTSGCST
jgi:hypothetical protein